MPDVPFARPVGLPQYASVPLIEPPLRGLSRREAALDLLLVLLVTVVLQYGPQLLLMLWMRRDSAAEFSPQVGSVLFAVSKYAEMLIAATILAYLALRHRIPPADFGLAPAAGIFGWLRSLGIGLLALLSCYVVFLPLALVSFLIGMPFVDPVEEVERRMRFAGAMQIESAAMLTVIMAAVAVHEEVIFRGLLIPYLRRVTGGWVAAVGVSSLIFAVLHIPGQGVLVTLPIFGIGVVLSVIFVLTRNLPAVILAHFAFNVLQFVVMRALADQMPRMPD